MISYILLSAIILLSLLDWYTTRIVLRNGGVELNPIARFGMDHLGVDGYLLAKGILVTAITWWAGTQSLYIAGAIVISYILVVVNNWRSMP